MIIAKFQNWLAFKRAMWRWWGSMPFIGDRRWGCGAQRRKNIDIAHDRWDAKKPDCSDFGLDHLYVTGEEHCRRCYRKRDFVFPPYTVCPECKAVRDHTTAPWSTNFPHYSGCTSTTVTWPNIAHEDGVRLLASAMQKRDEIGSF